MLPVSIQYFIDVLSQWCLISDRALLSIRMQYADCLPIRYRFVPMSGREPIYVDAEGQRKAHERSAFMTGVRTTQWLQSVPQSTWQANAAVIASAELGVDIERARHAVSHAALHGAAPFGDDGATSKFLASRFGLDVGAVEEQMEGAVVRARMADDAEAFNRYGLSLRPSFVLENEIGDWTIINGGHREALLMNAVSSLLIDGTGYDWFARHVAAEVDA
jgi:predicted DsbA family dithiol-disulfide isomerase